VNQKTARRLRQKLRAAGIDPRARSYKHTNVKDFPLFKLNDKGEIVPNGFIKNFTRTSIATGGRGVYLEAKKRFA
jgi:hypothetical protein